MINGFVVIDKPAGITSHDVVSRVRRILGTRKVGHTGTLDPFATGVLPIAVNDGTKAIPFLDEGVKCYEAVMQLGVATDTLDMTGVVLRTADWQTVTREEIESVLKQFTGHLRQIPPMYSAIKQGGQPLYKLARRGQVVDRPAREIDVRSLELLSFSPPLVSFRVVCSRGTYVRTLADDMGTILGCGGSLKELRRIASGPFDISAAVTLEGLAGAAQLGTLEYLTVTPLAALSHLQEIPLSDGGLALVRHGRSPTWPATEISLSTACEEGTLVRLTHGGNLIAVAECRSCGAELPRIILKRVFV
ncbi:MAG: tRNA pseudouridine(55) synthase TruB [Desulfobacteraceae bacterium]|nr:tRNA pseudouridine(55) synthase TruB [Desulfobacteraceae bacterium]